MRRFDLLALGERRRSGEWVLDEPQIVAFAQQFDPQWFHVDPPAARASEFGGLIASGVHLLAIARRLDHVMNGDVAFICGVAFEQVRFLAPGRPGDRLRLDSEIVALRPSGSRDDRGVVTHDYRLGKQDGEAVLSYRSVSLMQR